MIRLDEHYGGGKNNVVTKQQPRRTQPQPSSRQGGTKGSYNNKNKRSFRVVTKGRPPKSAQSISSPFNRKANHHHQHAFKNPTTPIKSRKFVNKVDENSTAQQVTNNQIHTMGVLQPSGRQNNNVDRKRTQRMHEFQSLTVNVQTPMKTMATHLEATPMTQVSMDVSPRSQLSTPESTVSMNTPPASRSTFMKLVSTSPLYSVRDELKEGSRLFRKKQYTLAIEHWMRVLKQCPHNGGVLHAIGLAYDQAGSPQKCKLWIRKAAALSHLPSCFVLAVMLKKGIGLMETSYDDEDDESEDEKIPQRDFDESKKLFIKVYTMMHADEQVDERDHQSLDYWAHEVEDLMQLNFLPNQEASNQSMKPTTAIYEFSFIHM